MTRSIVTTLGSVRRALPGSGPYGLAIGAAILSLTLVGAAVRWAGLRSHGLWLDEIGEVVTASLPLPELFASVRSQAGAAPLDVLGVKAVTALFGDGTTAARLWSFGVATLAIPLAYLAGAALWRSRLAGLLAALLVALSPFLILYAREARFYSLAVAMALGIVVAHSVAARRPTRWRRWVAYGVVVAAGVLTQYYVALVAVALGAADVIGMLLTTASMGSRPRVRGQLVAAAVAVAIAGPWVVYALPTQLGGSFYWDVPEFTPDAWWSTVVELISRSDPSVPESAVIVAVFLVVAAVGVLRRPSAGRIGVAMAAVALIPVVWLMASRSGYQVTARHAIVVAPLVYIATAGGLATTVEFVRQRWGQVVAAALAAVVSLGLVAVSWSPVSRVIDLSGSPSEDWPGASRFVASVVCEDATIFSNLDAGQRYGIAYYERRLEATTQVVLHQGEAFQDALARRRPRAEDMVVVLAYAGGADSPNVRSLGLMRAWFAHHGWEERSFGTQLYVYYRATCAPPLQR